MVKIPQQPISLQIKQHDAAIYIVPDVWAQWKSVERSCGIECSALGHVVPLANNQGVLVDRLIYPAQTNSAASTEMDDESVAKMIEEQHKLGYDRKDWKFWIHSHSRMNVFYSGTDVANIARYLSGGQWMCSAVTNLKGDITAKFHINFPCFVEKETAVEMFLEDQLVDTDVQDILSRFKTHKVETNYLGWKGGWESSTPDLFQDSPPYSYFKGDSRKWSQKKEVTQKGIKESQDRMEEVEEEIEELEQTKTPSNVLVMMNGTELNDALMENQAIENEIRDLKEELIELRHNLYKAKNVQTAV